MRIKKNLELPSGTEEMSRAQYLKLCREVGQPEAKRLKHAQRARRYRQWLALRAHLAMRERGFHHHCDNPALSQEERDRIRAGYGKRGRPWKVKPEVGPKPYTPDEYITS